MTGKKTPGTRGRTSFCPRAARGCRSRPAGRRTCGRSAPRGSRGSGCRAKARRFRRRARPGSGGPARPPRDPRPASRKCSICASPVALHLEVDGDEGRVVDRDPDLLDRGDEEIGIPLALAGSRRTASPGRAARWACPGRTTCRRGRCACRCRRRRAGSTDARAAGLSASSPPEPRPSRFRRSVSRSFVRSCFLPFVPAG